MLFILLFAVSMFLVPFAIDVHKHGADNILRRSGQDILHLPFVVSFLRSLGIFVDKVSGMVAATASLTFIFATIWVLERLVQFIWKIIK